jgi:hypothetical protein
MMRTIFSRSNHSTPGFRCDGSSDRKYDHQVLLIPSLRLSRVRVTHCLERRDARLGEPVVRYFELYVCMVETKFNFSSITAGSLTGTTNQMSLPYCLLSRPSLDR